MDSPFSYFPAWAVAAVMVVEVLISFFFCFAWCYAIKIARDGREQGKKTAAVLEEFVQWVKSPPADPVEGNGTPAGPEDLEDALKIIREIEERRSKRRAGRGA